MIKIAALIKSPQPGNESRAKAWTPQMATALIDSYISTYGVGASTSLHLTILFTSKGTERLTI